jgi:endonuclease G
MGAEIYQQNPLDLGHLVRRLDPAWGETEALAKVANDDTFHFTNCSPQHKNLNENKTTWAGLEDYILANAIANDLKVCVFSGPLFATDDPVYRNVQIPQQYWKVVVMVKTDGNLSATAYLLDQSQLIANLGARGFEFGSYRMFQVTVETIEQATGLQFDDLREHDPLAGRRGLNEVEITGLDMIQF